MADGSTKVVYAALAGNLAIAVVKFAAFFFTRSSAMLTEAIHSLVDTADQVLLLIGQKRGEMPPNERHPMGYGMEVYFWSFIVALMVFLAGGAVAIWEGVTRILHPEEMNRPWINFLVLGVAMVFEASSFAVAYREFRRVVRGRRVHVWDFIKGSKDPNVFMTLLEDGAALIGLFIAALGVAGSALLHLPWADGAASIAIGVVLLGVSFVLANETRSLIAGESAAPAIVDAVKAAISRDDRVAKVDDLVTLHLGPRSILVGMAISFRHDLSGRDVASAARDLTRRVKAADPRIGLVFLRPAD